MSNFRRPEDMQAQFERCTQFNLPKAPRKEKVQAQSPPEEGKVTDRRTAATDTVAMSNQNDYHHELALRDELLRKELQIRQDAFARELDAREQTHVERTSAILRRLEDRDKVIDSKLDALGDKVRDIDSKVGGFEAKLEATRETTVSQVRSSNREVLLGVLAIGVATVLGVWGVNSTIISSASGIFSAGRDDQKAQQANEQLLKETQEILMQLKAQQSAPAQAPAVGQSSKK